MRHSVILVMLMASTASIGLAQVQPVLTVSFDKGFDGVGRAGLVKGTLVGNPVLVPGKFGQCLKAGPTTGQVDYPTQGLLSASCGTVEMWVCPVDWAPDDEKFHVLFETRGQGALYLYEYWVGARLLMLTCGDVSGPYASSQHPSDGWKHGEWHHIAGTWSPKGVMCYVDGHPTAPAPAPGSLPKALGTTFRIGDQPWQFPRTTSSLVDEVRIYDRALTPAHIKAHFAGQFDFTVPLSEKTAKLDCEIDPVAGSADVLLDTAGADVDDSRLTVMLGVVRKGAEGPKDLPKLKFTGGLASATLPLPSRQPGEYEVVGRVLLDGQPAFVMRRGLTIPTTEWLGNRLGLEDKVLPPWTPLEVQGSKVTCWGRDYTFGDSPLPTQITSLGKELLAGALTIKLAGSERSASWKAGSREQTLSAARTRFEARGSLTGVLAAKPLSVAIRTTVEYDGLMLVELSLPHAEDLALDSVSLEIPVRADHAVYRHRWAASWAGVTGNLPGEAGVVDHDKFIPYYWLGDNDRGLFWFCESDEMWPNGRAANAIEVVRANAQVVLRLNLLASGQKLPPNWKFVFGLQATPVKPMPKDWRKWRMEPGRNPNVKIVWPVPNKKDSLSDFGYPRAADTERFAAHISALQAKGMRTAPYLCLTFITDGIPEWQYFRKIWEMGPVDNSTVRVGWRHMFPMVSPLGKGYSDFIAWTTHRFLKRYGIDGLYHDQTHPYTSKNTRAGVGYLRDGKEHSTFPILGFRALYRRIYAIHKAMFPDGFTMAHMSGKVTIPILAYEDSYLDGEHFRGTVKDSYMDVVSLDTFRAEFMGRQWGVMPVFLPEFRPPYSEQVEPTRGMMALLMIHDVSIWPIWCNAEVVNEALAALDEFGYVDAEFIPYFDPSPPASTNMADVYVSAYRRGDGRALLVAGNLSREDRTGNVRIHAQRLGFPLSKVTSWPDKTPISVTDSRVALKVPRLGYRMLLVESE